MFRVACLPTEGECAHFERNAYALGSHSLHCPAGRAGHVGSRKHAPIAPEAVVDAGAAQRLDASGLRKGCLKKQAAGLR